MSVPLQALPTEIVFEIIHHRLDAEIENWMEADQLSPSHGHLLLNNAGSMTRYTQIAKDLARIGSPFQCEVSRTVRRHLDSAKNLQTRSASPEPQMHNRRRRPSAEQCADLTDAISTEDRASWRAMCLERILESLNAPAACPTWDPDLVSAKL